MAFSAQGTPILSLCSTDTDGGTVTVEGTAFTYRPLINMTNICEISTLCKSRARLRAYTSAHNTYELCPHETYQIVGKSILSILYTLFELSLQP
jgi:hypothetical protein